MKQRLFLYILIPLIAAMLNSKMAFTQSHIDSLWSLLKRSSPISESSPVWELAGKKEIKETCISGDCTNGYGISISNDGAVAGRHQYEGGFLNAKHHGAGIIKTANSLTRVGHFENGKEVGAYIMYNNGLMKLQNANGSIIKKVKTEFGFTLTDVQKHLAYSFEKFAACNCLGRATHIEETEYQQPYDVIDEFKNNKGTNYKTVTRRVEYPGLRNNCPNIVFVKAIAFEGGYYFDRSVAVLPGATIMKRPFNAIYNPGKEGVQYLGQYEAAPVSK
jgi:hypothetical protein